MNTEQNKTTPPQRRWRHVAAMVMADGDVLVQIGAGAGGSEYHMTPADAEALHATLGRAIQLIASERPSASGAVGLRSSVAWRG